MYASERQITAGDAVLGGFADPRPSLRARRLPIVDVIDDGPLPPLVEAITKGPLRPFPEGPLLDPQHRSSLETFIRSST